MQKEVQGLQDVMNGFLTKERIATTLVTSLGGEKVRWTNNIKEYEEEIFRLVGDALIYSGLCVRACACACVGTCARACPCLRRYMHAGDIGQGEVDLCDSDRAFTQHPATEVVKPQGCFSKK